MAGLVPIGIIAYTGIKKIYQEIDKKLKKRKKSKERESNECKIKQEEEKKTEIEKDIKNSELKQAEEVKGKILGQKRVNVQSIFSQKKLDNPNEKDEESCGPESKSNILSQKDLELRQSGIPSQLIYKHPQVDKDNQETPGCDSHLSMHPSLYDKEILIEVGEDLNNIKKNYGDQRDIDKEEPEGINESILLSNNEVPSIYPVIEEIQLDHIEMINSPKKIEKNQENIDKEEHKGIHEDVLQYDIEILSNSNLEDKVLKDTEIHQSDNFDRELESLLCPISQELLTDPVMTPYGHCYQREHIEKWLENHSTCPLTLKPLTKSQLIPCFTIKNLVLELEKCKSHPTPSP